MLYGRVKPDGGVVAVRKGTRMSCVTQISEFSPGVTVRGVIEGALKRARVPEEEHASEFAETLGRAGFTALDALRRSFRAAGKNDWRLRKRWCSGRTSCCWTNRRTIWTSLELAGWKECCKA